MTAAILPHQNSINLDNCAASDANLLQLYNIMCSSIGGFPECNVTCDGCPGLGDWPNQAIYMNNLLEALVDPSTCLNTSVAIAVILLRKLAFNGIFLRQYTTKAIINIIVVVGSGCVIIIRYTSISNIISIFIGYSSFFCYDYQLLVNHFYLWLH